MRIYGIGFAALGAALTACLPPVSAQTPAVQSLSAYHAVRVPLGCSKPIPANPIAEFATAHGEWYVVDTKQGRTIVDRQELLGLPSVSKHRAVHLCLPANVPMFR